MSEPLVEVKGLKKYFPIGSTLSRSPSRFIHAVDDVNLGIERREIMGLVGESGCGKTTAAKCILRLYEPTDGDIFFKGKSILKLKKKEMKRLRREMQIVFQDPFGSLNPRMTICDIIGRGMKIHGLVKTEEKEKKVSELLEKVGLSPACLFRFPHEFSGGQRQRIAIARALALKPDFVILDEPTSALDVSVQAKILNLLLDLQADFGLTYLFITHDLSLIRSLSNRVSVMYAGKIVEIDTTEDIFSKAIHPYTEALFSSIPISDPRIKKKRIVLRGEVPNPSDLPPGCRFHPRCPYAKDICRKEEPELVNVGNEHQVSCHTRAR